MRLNKYIAQATGMSRRAADALITNQRVRVNGQVASVGTNVEESDSVKLDDKIVQQPAKTFVTIIFNKPAGYVSSRRGQGSKTVYDLLPAKYHTLKTVGRLDKDSSGLLVLTNDGQLAHRLTHPRYQKTKQYEVALNRPLTAEDQSKIERGVLLNDGLSALALQAIGEGRRTWHISMQEGRNRQIRRTFDALGYSVTTLHRTDFGPYSLDLLPAGEQYREVASV